MYLDIRMGDVLVVESHFALVQCVGPWGKWGWSSAQVERIVYLSRVMVWWEAEYGLQDSRLADEESWFIRQPWVAAPIAPTGQV